MKNDLLDRLDVCVAVKVTSLSRAQTDNKIDSGCFAGLVVEGKHVALLSGPWLS